jgi:hypothetical protein
MSRRRDVRSLWQAPTGGSPSLRAHGRRDTNAYPPTANTTGIMIKTPNNMLIIVSNSLGVVLAAISDHTAVGGW